MKEKSNELNSYNFHYAWRIGWKRSLDALHIVHDGIYNAPWLKNKCDKFCSHFITGTTINDRMDWKGTRGELCYLLLQLMEIEAIPERKDILMLAWEHFTIYNNEIKFYPLRLNGYDRLNYLSKKYIDSIVTRINTLS